MFDIPAAVLQLDEILIHIIAPSALDKNRLDQDTENRRQHRDADQHIQRDTDPVIPVPVIAGCKQRNKSQ